MSEFVFGLLIGAAGGLALGWWFIDVPKWLADRLPWTRNARR